MPRNSTALAVDRRLAEADRASGRRFIDLQVDFLDERDDALIGRLGGRFDKRLGEYVGDAETSRVLRCHVGQLEYVDWFCNYWLPRHLAGWNDGPPIYTVAGVGGRRGGKTTALGWCTWGYAVAVPKSIAWGIAPSGDFFEELEQSIEGMLPLSWYTSLGAPHYTYHLANGSRIRLLSGFTPKKLKKGRADIVMINEAQQLVSSSFTHARASISDSGGIVQVAANPPDVGDPGTWVADLVSEKKRGDQRHAQVFFFDPMVNPHIDKDALNSMRENMSEHEFNIQVRGMFLLPRDRVLHAWDRSKNEAIYPDIGVRNVTREIIHRVEGWPDIESVWGVDVQKYPWMVGIGARFVEGFSGHMEDLITWFNDESYIDEGDEVELAEDIKRKGYDPDRTLIICDASGRWQQAERSPDKQRAPYRGKGSWDMFNERGFRYVVGPDRDMDKNPDVIERIRAANARIRSADKRNLVYVDPVACPRTVEGITKWRNRKEANGPSRTSKHAHGGDALTYLLWRFFPRRAAANDSFDFSVVTRLQGRRRVKGY